MSQGKGGDEQGEKAGESVEESIEMKGERGENNSHREEHERESNGVNFYHPNHPMKSHGPEVMINPPDETPLLAGDEVIVIAEDDDTYEPCLENIKHRMGVIQSSEAKGRKEEKGQGKEKEGGKPNTKSEKKPEDKQGSDGSDKEVDGGGFRVEMVVDMPSMIRRFARLSTSIRPSPSLSSSPSSASLSPSQPVIHPSSPSMDLMRKEVLLCGWRRDLDDLIMVLEEILSPGSQLHLISQVIEFIYVSIHISIYLNIFP